MDCRCPRPIIQYKSVPSKGKKTTSNIQINLVVSLSNRLRKISTIAQIHTTNTNKQHRTMSKMSNNAAVSEKYIKAG